MKNRLHLIAMFSVVLVASNSLLAEEKTKSPADGYNIHIIALHRHEDGTVHSPYYQST